VTRFLALDWDQNQLHVVEGTVRGHSVAIRRAAVWNQEHAPNPAEAEAQGRLLRERLREAGIAPAPVLACVGRDRVILKDVRYPAVPEAEEPALVRFQAAKELTDAPDEVVIDYTPVGDRPGTGEYRALALVLRRELLAAYQALCQAAGLKLAGLTPRPFGLAACVRRAMGGRSQPPAPELADGAVAVMVSGERWAEFCMLRGQALLLARPLTPGAGLAAQVRRNLAVHAGQAPQQPVRALYLAGPGSGELREQLAGVLDLPLHPLDPFAGASDSGLPAGERGSFAGAAGLLLAKAEPGGLPVNFVQPRQPAPPRNPYRTRILAGLAGAVALFALLIVGALHLSANYQRELTQLEDERAALDEQLAAAQADGQFLKALDEWDGPVMLDELYEIAARIPDIRALRVRRLSAEPQARSAKSPYAARVTLEGDLVDGSKGRDPVDQLVAEIGREGYYSLEAPRVNGNQFTLTIYVRRRGPGEYTRALQAPAAAAGGAGSTLGGAGSAGRQPARRPQPQPQPQETEDFPEE
jgi:Tfp pilus assembly PilM family ATPase